MQRCVLQQHDCLAVPDLSRGDSGFGFVHRQLEHLDIFLLDATSHACPLGRGIFGHEEVQDLRD